MTPPRQSALVSAQWLARNATQVLIVDASVHRASPPQPPYATGRHDFEAAHIPGAQFADLVDDFSDRESALPFMRPPAAQLAESAAAIGIGPGTDVVVYDRLSGAWAARLWWVFRSYGVNSIRVLDGGLRAWLACGYEVESGPPRSVPHSAPPALVNDPAALTSINDVADLRDAGHPVLCALRREEFDGTPTDRRSGHIPGSLAFPYAETLDEHGRFSAAATRALAARTGVRPGGATPILYCGGAINAAGVALALAEIGIAETSVFDGSLAQWTLRSDHQLAQTKGGNDERA